MNEAVKTPKPGYGDFGNLAEKYNASRQAYPNEIIDLFFAKLRQLSDSFILDLGCGTGLVTRQMAKRAGRMVTGCDIDRLMISVAKKKQAMSDGIDYLVAPAENLPFADAAFDAVTAFSAFHWFANDKALAEIKRVLIFKEGLFFSANKNDVGSFKPGFSEIIREAVGYELPQAKNDYEPEKLLIKTGFQKVATHNLPASEFFTLPEALNYLQSVSIWNLVPEKKKAETLERLEEYCVKQVTSGWVERTINVRVVLGFTN